VRAGFKDIASGLIFLGFGIAFGTAAAGYPIGTAFRMGPGYFPLLLAGALGLLGLAIIAKGVRASGVGEDFGPVPWRALVFILGAIIVFGATVRGLGLAPSVFVTAFLGALASRSNPPLAALVLAAGMTAFCVLIFHYGLGVALPLFGPWIPG
jgi:hypothetical protein